MIAFASALSPIYIYQTLSEASGSEGRAVEKELRTVRSRIGDSVSQGGRRLQALASLDEFYELAAQGNWDGEGSLAVTNEAYVNARRFLEQIPGHWQNPEINADPDGEISIEWAAGSRRRFSVSIGPDERISYAWLLGAERGHSVNTFVVEIPRQFLDHVDQVLSR